MTENEFAEKLVDLKKQIGIMDIVIGRESLADFVLGCCYDEDIKKWKVYKNHERGWHSIRLVTESEEEAFDKLFSMVNSEIESVKRYNARKKHTENDNE